MNKKLSRTTIAAAIVIAFGNTAFAAEPIDTAGVFTLGEIHVSGSRQNASATGDGVVAREDIEDFNRLNVQEALDLLPGITKIGGGQRNESMVYVRGFDSRQVPVFIDGIPVYVSYDGNVDLARFTTYDLASIEVAKGFSSVLYGPNTLGGAINLISRKPSKAFEGNIGVGVIANDRFNSNGTSTDINLGTNQGMWYAQLGMSYLDKDAYTLSRDFRPTSAQPDRERRNAYSTDKKVNVKVGLTPNATDEYALNYINQKGEKGSPLYAGTIDTPRDWSWPAWNKESLYFISNTAIGQNSYLKTRVYYDKFSNELLTSPTAKASIYDDHTYGGSVEFGTKLSASNTLKVAFHLKEDFHKEHNEGEPEQPSQDRTSSISIEDTHKLSNKLDLVVGASYDQRKGKQAQEYAGTPARLFDFKLSDTSAFNPQAGLIYHTSTTGNAYLTVARKSRFPTIKDRYSGRFGRAVPNPDLDVERSTNYQLGLSEKISSSVRVEAAVFYNDITNMIQSVTLPNNACASPPCSQARNIGEVATQGFELGLTSTLSDTLELGGNYSYIDRKNKSSAERLTNIPRSKFLTYAKWAATPQLRVIGNLEYNSSRVSSSDGTRVAAGFSLANVKFSYALQKDVTLEAGVNNLFDRNYAYNEGYFEAGRNFFAKLNYSF